MNESAKADLQQRKTGNPSQTGPAESAPDGAAEPILWRENDAMRPVFVRINPANIVLLKFILESYEDLGALRTLDSERGEVVILALVDTVRDLDALLRSMEADLEFQIVEPPPEFRAAYAESADEADDWLLGV